MSNRTRVVLFIDEEAQPIAELSTPVTFELDTTRLVDGPHSLRIVSQDAFGKEGIRIIPFEVRNGPAIAIEGLRADSIVDGTLPIMINAYGKGDQKSFVITGSETPQSIPFWIYILLILFFGWGIYYLVTMSHVNLWK